MSGHQAGDNINEETINSFRNRVLGWYDRHRRVLPWRALSGQMADPYHVWLSEIMLQQTLVAAAIPYFLKFLGKWPTVQVLAAAPNDDVMEAWAGLGYYARARNLHKCAQVIAKERSGIFPSDQADLKTLPGIGDYTAAAIASIAFDQPASVVDGNVERVLARWFGIEEPLPAAKKILRIKAGLLSDGRDDRPGDFAQAMMDIGATVCTPKSPRCGSCPLHTDCAAFAKNIAEELPRRSPKGEKPQKFGYIYWIVDEKGHVLFERRTEESLLGGMPGLPTSAWVERKGKKNLTHSTLVSKIGEGETQKNLRIFHSFTHFDLELEGRVFKVKKRPKLSAETLYWVAPEDLAKVGLPTVFKKFAVLMMPAKKRV